MSFKKYLSFTVEGKKYREKQERNAKLAEIKAKQEERLAQAQEAFKSDEFITILSEHPDFEPEMIDGLENNPKTVEFITTRFEAFKEKSAITSEFKAVFTEAFTAELKTVGIEKPDALDKKFWDKVSTEIDNEIRNNPEGLLDLRKSLIEHAENQKQIKSLEQELRKLNAPNPEQQQYMRILDGIDPDHIADPSKLSLDQRQALTELGKYFDERNSVQVLAKTYRALDNFSKLEQASEASDKLDDLKKQARNLRETIFAQNKYREIINIQLDAAHNKHYADLVAKVDAGNQQDLEAYLEYNQALLEQRSEFGSVERKINSLAQGNKSGEEILAKAAEAVQNHAEQKYKNEVIAAVQKHQTFNKLDRHLDEIIGATRIGAKKNAAEIQRILEDAFAEIYHAPSTTKDQKTHLRIYLKTHNLNGKL